MLTVDGLDYKYLGNNIFRNTQTHEVIDGNKIRGQNFVFANGGDYRGVWILGTTISFGFKTSKCHQVYLRKVAPRIKKEIEHSIPLKDDQAKQKVLKCVTRYASCNYNHNLRYALYKLQERILGAFGKSDWQAARKAMLAEMDKNAAHLFLKDCVGKFKFGRKTLEGWQGS